MVAFVAGVDEPNQDRGMLEKVPVPPFPVSLLATIMPDAGYVQL
jgi:hypothetical protein